MTAEEIQNWFNSSLVDSSERKSPTAYDFIVEGVGAAVEAIEKKIALFGTVLATTVRQSINEDSDYLRPLSAWPDAVRRYFEDEQTQEPFSIPKIQTFLTGGVRGHKHNGHIGVHGHIIDDFCCAKARSQGKAGIQQRINKFITEVDDVTLRASLVGSHCITVLDIEGNRGCAQKVRSILAIYYKRNTTPTEEDYRAIERASKELFENVRMLRNLDSIIFRSKSAELINNLVELFINSNVAKADKVAFALAQIRKLTSAHLIGRNFCAHRSMPRETDDGEGAISAHFIQTRFERSHATHDVAPKLELYPLVMAMENPLGALIVANPDLPMLSKLLLRQYMSSKEVRLYVSRDEADRAIKQASDDGLQIPQGHATISPNFCSTIVSTRLKSFGGARDDQLAISRSHDPVLWDECYRNIECDRKARKYLVAFVVEGEIVSERYKVRLLPHGVIFFEGWLIDSFSKADIDTLRILAIGFSSLMRLTSHAMSPLSYDRAIWKTYNADVSSLARGDLDHAEVLFHFLRLDAALLHEIIPVAEDEVVMETLSKAERDAIKIAAAFIAKFKEPLANEPDRKVDFRTAGQLLRERRNFYMSKAAEVEAFKEEMDKQTTSGAFMSFLRSCPSNFVWSPYLGTVGEVLADRISTRSLSMARINVGFSADAVILAAVNGEFSQIVKLASKKKLKAEKDAYLRFVRYRIPYAARQPMRGLALDSSGRIGFEAGLASTAWMPFSGGMTENDQQDHQGSFGALVSDVVDGERPRRDETPQDGYAASERIETLESKIAAELCKGSRQRARSSDIKDVLSAIRDHFRVGIKLWRVPHAERKDWESERIDKHSLGETSVAQLVEHRLRMQRSNVGKPLALSDQIVNTMDEFINLGLGPIIVLVSRSSLPLNKLTEWLRERGEKVSGNANAKTYLTSELAEAASKGIVHPEVIHGDLNPRNLAWSHTFSRFFMIDFERTGYGFAGIDHWKLVSSLLVDIFWASYGRHSEGKDANARVAMRLGGCIDTVLAVFDGFTDLMEGPDNIESRERVSNQIAEFSAAKHSCGVHFLADAIATILMTLFTEQQGSSNRLNDLFKAMTNDGRVEDVRDARQKRFTLNLYIACCAALRELQYSVEDLKDHVALPGKSLSILIGALQAKGGSTIGELASAGIESLQDDDDQQQLRILIRAIIAFRLLLAVLPTVEPRSAS